jgi:hypothetical protein
VSPFAQSGIPFVAVHESQVTKHESRLFPPLCFHTLTNCFSDNPFLFTTIRVAPGCGWHFRSVLTSHGLRVTSHVFSWACRLFVAPKKVNSFAIKQIQALLPKYRGGVGIPNASTGCRGGASRTKLRDTRGRVMIFHPHLTKADDAGDYMRPKVRVRTPNKL